ncbi:MAG: hypothetical protein AB7S75_16940 [Desulfococcaceae bacterium]
MKKTSEKGRTRWHILLGKLLQELLEPLGITVYTEFSVMAAAPRADILLIRKKHMEWTPEQLRFLPDGIRDSNAEHILIEFKYTESVTKKAFRQILGYETFYTDSHNLADREVQSFVISSKTPGETVLKDMGYFPSEKTGVYRHDFWMLEKIPLICLNELTDEPHNAFVKCFASQRKEKIAAVSALRRLGLGTLRLQVQWFLEGLLRYWFSEKGEYMETMELTPEKVTEMGKMWADLILSGLSTDDILTRYSPDDILSRYKPEERLKGLGPEEVMSMYKPEERLKGLGTEERLKGLGTEERLKGLGPEERLKGLGPEERLKGLDPEERLKGLSAEEIEAYLRKIRKNEG